MNPGREAALRVLTACQKEEVRMDAALNRQMERAALSPADAALCSRIVSGVMQNRLLLDFYCGAYCSQAIDHLQEPLADILRIGAYQILFLDRIPPHAAVDQSVELARLCGRGQAGGLVNAVLRRVAEHRDSLPPLPGADGSQGNTHSSGGTRSPGGTHTPGSTVSPGGTRSPDGTVSPGGTRSPDGAFLSLRYSHPRWLTDRLLSLLGPGETEAFLRMDNEIPPLTIQTNTLRTDEASLLAELRAAGLAAEPHPWGGGLLSVSGAGDITALPAFQKGAFFVQDAAASLAVRCTGLQPGQSALDVCAAPGGKSFAAALAMKDCGKILSCDISEGKLRLLRQGAARLGLASLTAVCRDGREFCPDWSGQFDAVLVDVPCSGLGVIRKKPDIRWKNPASFAGLPAIQGAILANAGRYVRPGGVLVYSTCTILPEENQGVTDAFLREHPEFIHVSIPADRLPISADGLSESADRISVSGDRISESGDELSESGAGYPVPAGDGDGTEHGLTLWPQRHGTDGFYIRLLRRKE